MINRQCSAVKDLILIEFDRNLVLQSLHGSDIMQATSQISSGVLLKQNYLFISGQLQASSSNLPEEFLPSLYSRRGRQWSRMWDKTEKDRAGVMTISLS